MQRIIAYIDGYNLYYGLRDKGWKRFYWLNLSLLCEQFLKPGQFLVHTHYFTTIVKQPNDRRLRQKEFLEALGTLPKLSIHYGKFLTEQNSCKNCGYTYTKYNEKMTDVNIAVQLLSDAFQDQFDLAFLISADSDLVGPVDAVHRLFGDKKVIGIFPPDRFSSALNASTYSTFHINSLHLAKSQFPDSVRKGSITLHRPSRWR